MNIFPQKRSFSPATYAPGFNDAEPMYGLPEKIQFCSRCTISNQRPNSTIEFQNSAKAKKETINFDAEGICDACRVTEQKHCQINWEDRREELVRLCDKYRRTDGRYDCIVPGSGGKDSAFASHILKAEFGMHPLTVTWAPHIYTDWGWKNFQAWIHAGLDNYLITPNGRTTRLLARLALETMFHPFQPFIIGQRNVSPRLALQYDVPLVFYGENQAEYGNPIATNASALQDQAFFMSRKKPEELMLGGVEVGKLIRDFGLDIADLALYLPIKPEAFEKKTVDVHYLGYYLKWHPQGAYYYAVEHCGFEAAPERSAGTFSKYNSIDDKMDDLHYYTTFIKFGIGRATYESCQELRSGDIDRDEAVALVKRFDGEFPDRFVDELFQYLSIPEDQYPVAFKNFEQANIDRAYFEQLTNSFRSPHLWKQHTDQWALRHTVHD